MEFDRFVCLENVFLSMLVVTVVITVLIFWLFSICRIHYPLPLPYVGKPDPASLQKEIRALRAELTAVTSHGVNKSAELEIHRLRAEYVEFIFITVTNMRGRGTYFSRLLLFLRLALVKEEKESIAKVLERLQLSGGGSAPGREDWRARDVVRTLEEQLVKERAKSQRSASKRCQEQRLLIEQVEILCLVDFSWNGWSRRQQLALID